MREICFGLLGIALTINNVSAAVVLHEFAGKVYYSDTIGVSANDPFTLMLMYDSVQPDLLPDNPSQGKYAEFTISLHIGPISVTQTNPVDFDFGILDEDPLSDQIAWFGSIGTGDIGLSAYDRTGTAFNSDSLPTQLHISQFTWVEFRHFVSGDNRIDGLVLSIKSRIIPEPTALALLGLGSVCLVLRRERADFRPLDSSLSQQDLSINAPERVSVSICTYGRIRQES